MMPSTNQSLQDTPQYAEFIARREATYSAKRDAEVETARPQDSFKALEGTAEKSPERSKLLFNLQSSLTNLVDLEALVDLGARPRLAARSSSLQPALQQHAHLLTAHPTSLQNAPSPYNTPLLPTARSSPFPTSCRICRMLTAGAVKRLSKDDM